MVATARIVMPKSIVRLSAGRSRFSVAEQALCFLAGANSIFSSDTGTMLTKAVPTPDYDQDRAMFDALGLNARESFDGLDSNCRNAARDARQPDVSSNAR